MSLKHPDSRRSKIAKKGRRKGNSFERRIAKKFGELFYNDPKALVRAPRSGGGEWKGDIIANPNLVESFPLCIECKNQEIWTFTQLFKEGENKPILKYWKQTIKECPKNKIPILIFTKNFCPDFIGMSTEVPIFYGISHILISNNIIIYQLEELLEKYGDAFLKWVNENQSSSSSSHSLSNSKGASE